jgi:hypothetical protein
MVHWDRAAGGAQYAQIATGTTTRASGDKFADKKVIAQGLAGPVQMILGKDGAVYVTEAAGKLTRVSLRLVWQAGLVCRHPTW